MSNISNFIIPALVFYTIAMGLVQKRDVFSLFIKGSKEGLKIVIEILPTLIGLMVSVAVLRASGFFDCIGSVLKGLQIQFSEELINLFIVKLFSASASTGVAIDIFKKYGTDSFEGMAASLALSSTETVFYTIAVYYMSVNVTKTRWTIPAALASTVAGLIASVYLAGVLI